MARGDVRGYSDIDLIIVKKTKKSFLDQLDKFYDGAKEAMDIVSRYYVNQGSGTTYKSLVTRLAQRDA